MFNSSEILNNKKYTSNTFKQGRLKRIKVLEAHELKRISNDKCATRVDIF